MQAPTSPPVHVSDLIRILSRRKILLLTPWIMAVGLGVAAGILLPPVYSSSVTLLLERPQELSGALSNMVNAFDPERQAANMREQVQSTLFLRGVVTATGLKSEPDTRAEALKHSDPQSGTSADDRVEAYLVNELRDAVMIKRAKGSNTFQVSVEDHRPDRARRLADGIANQFILQAKSAQIEAVRRTQEFSVEQEQIYKRKVDESEARLEAFKRSLLNTSLSASPVGESNLIRARTLLDQSDLDVGEQRQRLASMRQQYASWVSSYDPTQLSSSETNAMAAQIKGLERQLAASALLSDDASDNTVSARAASARKTTELEVQFTQNASVAFPNAPPEARDALVRLRLAEVDLQAREARHDYLAAQVASYEHRVVMSPETDAQLKRLEADVDNDRALYNSFLQSSANAQITEAFENARVSGRFSVLEPAQLPVAPDKPNRIMLILLGFVLGGAVGVGSVFVVERHDQSMRNAEEVEMLLGLPVVGAIPRVEGFERKHRRSRTRGGPAPEPRDPGLLHRLKTESPLGLEFRRIFIKLAQSRGHTMPRTLLVTSSTRGEGKTTTSACLAITLAREIEERVLLVDFDLRSPALHRALGIPSSSWGVGHMLAQRTFDERFVRSTVLTNLDFLGAGKSERPASELVDSDSVEWFMAEARSRYPFVIVDAAPTLAVPDPLIVGRVVEGVLYVIKAGQTVRKAAEYGVKVQREAKDNIVGVLLNDAGDILPHYYGYHDAYGYESEAVSGES
jgi:capsular exopolysaccharide synthesis family protein